MTANNTPNEECLTFSYWVFQFIPINSFIYIYISQCFRFHPVAHWFPFLGMVKKNLHAETESLLNLSKWTPSFTANVELFVHLSVCCVLHQDKETGFHRGFCWIGFTTEEGLNNALEKDSHMLEGAKVKVNTKQERIGVLINATETLTAAVPL